MSHEENLCVLCSEPQESCRCDTVEKIQSNSGSKLTTKEVQKDIGKSDHHVAGKLVDKKFRIIDKIGAGGIATVFLAEHLYLQKKVALKLFLHLKEEEEKSISRIQREAIILANVSHPNVVAVLDLGITTDGAPYIVQEFVDGTDLFSIVEKKEPMSQMRALNLFTQIAEGLNFLHEQGIVHRDLKPANIVITKNGRGEEIAKIIDLGIAKRENPGGALHTLTTTGDIFGSPYYMSPEHCRGSEIDVRSDIYSLGCLMYETLAGVPPFRGATIMDTLNQHIKEKAPPVSRKNSSLEISHRLEEVIEDCLEKDPDKRPQSAREIVEWLNNIRYHKKVFSPRRTLLTVGSILIGLGLVLSIMVSSNIFKNRSSNDEPIELDTSKEIQLLEELEQCMESETLFSNTVTKNSYYHAYQKANSDNAGDDIKCFIASKIAKYEFLDGNYQAVDKLYQKWSPFLKQIAIESSAKESEKIRFRNSYAEFCYAAARAAKIRSNYFASENRFNRALMIAKPLPKRNIMHYAIIAEIGDLYVKTERVSEGIKLLEKSLNGAMKIGGKKVRITNLCTRICDYMANGCRKKGDLTAAVAVLNYKIKLLRANEKNDLAKVEKQISDLKSMINSKRKPL